VEWWTRLHTELARLLDAHSLLAACLLLFVEEAGVPIPVPGDFAMVLIGAQARQGRLALWQAIAALELATVAGGTLLYVATRWAGRPLVLRHGHLLRLTPARLRQAELRLQQHGVLAVAAARLIPGLRIVSVIACGLFGVPVHVFMPGLVVGSLVYITAYSVLGYFAGPAILTTLEQARLPLAALSSAALLCAVLVWLRRARLPLRQTVGAPSTPSALSVPPAKASSRRRAGATAGAFATLVSGLTMNVLSQFAVALEAEPPSTLIARAQVRLAQLMPDWPVVLIAAPVLVSIGVGWGSVYGLVQDRFARASLPDWLRGVLFATVPFAGWLLIGVPILGQTAFESLIAPGAVPAEAVRHLVYGAALGAAFPVFAARLRSLRTRRLARLGGSEPQLRTPPRRRASPE